LSLHFRKLHGVIFTEPTGDAMLRGPTFFRQQQRTLIFSGLWHHSGRRRVTRYENFLAVVFASHFRAGFLIGFTQSVGDCKSDTLTGR
jgi:hypothetical protein